MMAREELAAELEGLTEGSWDDTGSLVQTLQRIGRWETTSGDSSALIVVAAARGVFQEIAQYVHWVDDTIGNGFGLEAASAELNRLRGSISPALRQLREAVKSGETAPIETSVHSLLAAWQGFEKEDIGRVLSEGMNR